MVVAIIRTDRLRASGTFPTSMTFARGTFLIAVAVLGAFSVPRTNFLSAVAASETIFTLTKRHTVGSLFARAMKIAAIFAAGNLTHVPTL